DDLVRAARPDQGNDGLVGGQLLGSRGPALGRAQTVLGGAEIDGVIKELAALVLDGDLDPGQLVLPELDVGAREDAPERDMDRVAGADRDGAEAGAPTCAARRRRAARRAGGCDEDRDERDRSHLGESHGLLLLFPQTFAVARREPQPAIGPQVRARSVSSFPSVPVGPPPWVGETTGWSAGAMVYYTGQRFECNTLASALDTPCRAPRAPLQCPRSRRPRFQPDA